MRFVCGCCCQNTTYWKPDPWSKCIGCSSDNQLACLTYKSCLRAGSDPLLPTMSRSDGTKCFLGCGICGIGIKDCRQPEWTCIKNKAQFCCIVNGCAIPTVYTVPHTIGCCCMSCHPICGCCQNFAKLARASKNSNQVFCCIKI